MIQSLIGASLVIYFLFYLWDRKQIKDERAKLIELKASELQSRITLLTLVGLAIYYWINPEMPVWVCLLLINFANLYTEIAGKIFWNWRL